MHQNVVNYVYQVSISFLLPSFDTWGAQLKITAKHVFPNLISTALILFTKYFTYFFILLTTNNNLLKPIDALFNPTFSKALVINAVHIRNWIVVLSSVHNDYSTDANVNTITQSNGNSGVVNLWHFQAFRFSQLNTCTELLVWLSANVFVHRFIWLMIPFIRNDHIFRIHNMFVIVLFYHD